MKPSHTNSVRWVIISVSLFGWLCTAISISQLIVMQSLSGVSLSGPLPGNGNANTIRTKQSNELDDATTTSSLNTLFGSRLDKPSAGHHNCVELEIHTAQPASQPVGWCAGNFKCSGVQWALERWSAEVWHAGIVSQELYSAIFKFSVSWGITVIN